MYSPAAQGFGRVAANLGLNTLGSATGRNYERELGLGSTGLKGFAAIQAAKARGRAIEYAGRQAGRSAMFGGLMSGLGSLASAGISKGMMGGGGGGVDFSSTDAVTMGMSPDQAIYRAGGGATYWDSSMPVNQFNPVGNPLGNSYRGF